MHLLAAGVKRVYVCVFPHAQHLFQKVLTQLLCSPCKHACAPWCACAHPANANASLIVPQDELEDKTNLQEALIKSEEMRLALANTLVNTQVCGQLAAWAGGGPSHTGSQVQWQSQAPVLTC